MGANDDSSATGPSGHAVENGARGSGARLAEAVSDNRARNRFELTVDGQTAVLNYERRPQSIVLVHTEVPPALRGLHIGDALAKAAIDSARQEGLRIVPMCPFVKAYLEKHPPIE